MKYMNKLNKITPKMIGVMQMAKEARGMRMSKPTNHGKENGLLPAMKRRLHRS